MRVHRSSSSTSRPAGRSSRPTGCRTEYRQKLIKFIEMHANSELMGVLPEREWILKAPTLQRKLALTAKVQDEVGHAQLIYRVAEDLGKPRDEMFADLLSGKAKFHNVFHYPTKTWGDVGVIAWLVDAAAIISQKALLKCSYAPYARIMKKICWEESFHILHGRDVILAMMTGTDEQRELVQEALNRWWGPLMQFHGNPIARDEDPMFVWRIKSQGNEEARQQFLEGYVPQIWELGLTVPDPNLRRSRRRRLGVQRARLGRAEVGRHRARASLARAARFPPPLPRPGEVGSRHTARCLMPIYEVFRQEKKGQAFAHAGSVEAPDAAFAEAWAREQYGRRGESEALWLVPRESVHAITDWADEFDLKYRRVDGYSIKARLKEARERAGTAAPVDR